MKKFIYLCGMILFSLDIMAQIDTYDMNWDNVVHDDFNEPNRQFDSTFQEPFHKWISFSPILYPSGVTKKDGHSIFQWNQSVFDGENGFLRLNSSYIRSTPIGCNEQPMYYNIPPASYGRSFWCDQTHNSLYYYSSMIESPPVIMENSVSNKSENDWPLLIGQFRYGYFEIRCKVPVHRGAKSSFWLWGALTDNYYEEIDIYEFAWDFENPSSAGWTHNPHPHGAGNPYCFSSGMYINKEEASFHPMTSTSKAWRFLTIETPVSDWHTFACEWMPDHMLWYCDGKIIDEYYNPDSIPSHPLTVKASYQIDGYALPGHGFNNQWTGSGSMIIDYINVYQLRWDCSTDEVIASQSDLEHFNYAVKKSIAITSANGAIEVGSSDKVTFRTTDSFEITGSFQVNNGGEFTVIMQSCPADSGQ